MYEAGEKPGAGTYVCMVCGKQVTISDDEVLALCPQCSAALYR